MVASPIDPLALAIVAVAVVCLVPLVGYGLVELRIANRVLRSSPNAVLDATAGGPIELRGTARPVRGVLRSPFTETPCLAVRYAVEEERSSKNGSSWTTIDSGEEYVPFAVDDGSGSVLVEPPGADFRLEEHARIDVDGGTTPPASIQEFIDRTEDVDCQNSTLDLRVIELRTGNDRRFREYVLEPGETVHVLGTARYETNVSRTAGSVNAAVGIDERALAESPWRRLRHRLFGTPFVVSDTSERRLGLWAALRGIGAVLGAIVLATLVIAWLL